MRRVFIVLLALLGATGCTPSAQVWFARGESAFGARMKELYPVGMSREDARERVLETYPGSDFTSSCPPDATAVGETATDLEWMARLFTESRLQDVACVDAHWIYAYEYNGFSFDWIPHIVQDYLFYDEFGRVIGAHRRWRD